MEPQNLFHNVKLCLSNQAMRNLYEMRQNNSLCDATITLDNDVILYVHRPILSACSDYFTIAFNKTSSNYIDDESENNASSNNAIANIRIPGVSSYAMTRIIEFAYLRTCDLNEKSVYEVLVVADYVALIELVKYCIKFLVKSLSPENSISVLRFAQARDNKDLYEVTRPYVLRHIEEIAVKSDELLDLSIEELFVILNDNQLNVKDEYLVWECILRWINQDPELRKCHVPKLLRCIRLGCLQTTYFVNNIMTHQYVLSNNETQPIITEVLHFLHELYGIQTRDKKIITPPLAVPRLPHDVIFLTGGWQNRPVATVETYDTRADRWVNVPYKDPAGPRCYHGTAVIGHSIYVIGGFNARTFFNTCRVFDALNKNWREISPMHSHRCYVSVVELDGYIYALGGFDGVNRLSTCERYDPVTNQWTLIANMNVPRSDAHACVVDEKIFIAGIVAHINATHNRYDDGGFNGRICLNSAEYFDPKTNEWTDIPEMNVPRSGVSCIGYKGYLYVMGGFDGTVRLKTCERYCPTRKQWSTIPDMTYERSNFGIEILDDLIFVIGGYNGIIKIPFNECYNVANNQWLNATVMNKPRAGHKANVVKGLPNVKDYIYKDRASLIEERRLSMISSRQALQ